MTRSGRHQRFSARLTWLVMLVILVALMGIPGIRPGRVQAQAVDCSAIPCGPSGMFSREQVPTIAGVDFSAFPARLTRPYQPKGKVWYVQVDGKDSADGGAAQPFATIRRAIQAAGTGDAIEVGPGTYAISADAETNIALDKPGIMLYAERAATVILQASGGESESVIEASADDLIIDGFVIKSAPRGYGVYFGRLDRPQRNLVLRNLIIQGGEVGLNSVITPDGQANPQPVITGLHLEHALIDSPSLIGFNCGQGPCNAMRIENLVVRMTPDRTGENSGADGIAVENGDNILVFNVEVTGASADGLDFKATRVAVVNAHIHDVQRNGIKLWKGGDILNALVYNTGADASIVFHSGGAYRLAHATIARHAYDTPGAAYAMSVAYDEPQQPGTLGLYNCIFFQNSAAIWVSGAFKLDARNNLFFGSGNGQELVWGRDPEVAIGEEVDPVVALETAGGGRDNLGFIDPRFVDPASGRYTLRDDSPVRGKGAVNLPDMPDFDLYGKSRPSDKSPDLGPG